MFCLSKSSVKIQETTYYKKELIVCGLCSGGKSIITLDCKHKCCTKCFHKTKLCSQCEKEQSRCGY